LGNTVRTRGDQRHPFTGIGNPSDDGPCPAEAHMRISFAGTKCRSSERRPKEARTPMRVRRRILIANRRAGEAWEAHRRLERGESWRVSDIVDPRQGKLLDAACREADIILIEAGDLIWLLDHRTKQAKASFRSTPPMILIDDNEILNVVARAEAAWGLLIRERLATVSLDKLDLAAQGYLVIPGALVIYMRRDGPRLDVLARLSPEERMVLFHLGMARSNRIISRLSGLTESRVKISARTLTRKMQMRNRTALAVFAVANGLAAPLAPVN